VSSPNGFNLSYHVAKLRPQAMVIIAPTHTLYDVPMTLCVPLEQMFQRFGVWLQYGSEHIQPSADDESE
jgi:hypothetical protein